MYNFAEVWFTVYYSSCHEGESVLVLCMPDVLSDPQMMQIAQIGRTISDNEP